MEKTWYRLGEIVTLRPDQIRKSAYPLHRPATLDSKMQYIKKYGQIEPIKVYPADAMQGIYEVVDGENTLDCLLTLGADEILCYVLPIDKEEADVHRMLLNAHARPVDAVRLSEIIASVRSQMNIFELCEIGPYSASYIQDLELIAQFDWSQYRPKIENTQVSMFQ